VLWTLDFGLWTLDCQGLTRRPLKRVPF